jgi:hypothetical protein
MAAMRLRDYPFRPSGYRPAYHRPDKKAIPENGNLDIMSPRIFHFPTPPLPFDNNPDLGINCESAKIKNPKSHGKLPHHRKERTSGGGGGPARRSVMTRRGIAIAVVGLVYLSAASALSAGPSRKGFVFGFGLGGGYTAYTVQYPIYNGWLYLGEGTKSQGSGGVATDFKIGIGLSDHVVLLYTNKVLWFSFEEPRNNDQLFNQFGATMLGIDYFFRSSAPSPYLLLGVGASVWTPFTAEYESERWLGPALCVGAGFEFSRHWTIELSVLYGHGGGEDYLRAGRNPFAAMLMLNYLGY